VYSAHVVQCARSLAEVLADTHMKVLPSFASRLPSPSRLPDHPRRRNIHCSQRQAGANVVSGARFQNAGARSRRPCAVLNHRRRSHPPCLQNSFESAESDIRSLLARCEAQYYSSQYR
jgi:hypothetical protein